MKFFYTFKKYHPFCKALIALLLMLSFAQTLHSQPISAAISETKRVLTQRIDSLDLEKQTLKRLGQPVAEIENRQKGIIDSLNSIRKFIQSKTTEHPSVAGKLPENKFFFLKPQGYFDWLILIVASIAAISGLILIIGIIKTLSGKKKRKAGRTGLQAAQTYSQIKQFRLPEQSSAETGQLDNPDPLHSLRRRIDEEQKIENETPPTLLYENNVNVSERSTDIESLIFKAASEGLDVQEISRRLHVSADQVSLILKVIKKNRPK